MSSGGHAELKHYLITRTISDFIWDSAVINNNGQIEKTEVNSESYNMMLPESARESEHFLIKL